MKIRYATYDDCETVKNLDYCTFSDANYPFLYFIQSVDIFEKGFFVAETDALIVGYCIAGIAADHPSTGWLITMAVAKDNRRQGIGAALVSEAKEYLGTHGCHRILLTVSPRNKGAIRFYESHGFKRLELRENYFGPNEDRWVYEMRDAT